MSVSLIEEITAKTAVLPLEEQRVALAFIENPAQRKSKKPFRSVRGVLHNDLANLESDLREVRAEMWRDFPREEPN